MDIDDLACRTVRGTYLDIGRYILEILALDIGKLFLDIDDLACRTLSKIWILENILRAFGYWVLENIFGY